MANTINASEIFIEISAMDGDWEPDDILAVHSIELYPGAADDLIRVFAGSVSGPECCKLVSGDGEPRIKYFDGNKFTPVIDFNLCTLSANHKILVTLDSHRK